MNNSTVVITSDISEVMKQLDYFTTKDWINVEKRAIRAAASKIRNKAKRLFKSRLPNATKKSKYYSDTLLDAVRVSKVRSKGEHEISIKVHSMGSREPSSGSYRARMFNQGTKERYISYVDKLGRLYKNKHIGKLKELHYMDDAFSSFDTSEEMNKILAAKIIQINNKKLK